MSTWPQTLVEEIASRRAIPFIGAGASSAATNERGKRPPPWRLFLEQARDTLVSSGEDKAEATRLIGREQYLDAAEVIFRRVNGAEYSRFMQDVFVAPDYAPSRIHEIVRDLDTKCVITTNYDTLYESACGARGYTIRHHHDNNVLNAIRSPARLILKAHGCVQHADKTVLTRTHYHLARHNYPFFYSLLDGMFLLHTIVFIGVGLTDPDIQLVLENANLAVKCDHPHYALLAQGVHPALIDVMKTAYNIQVIEYDYDLEEMDHADCVAKLEELLADVQSLRASRGP